MNHTETRNRFSKPSDDDRPTDDVLSRKLPYDLDAERGVVGSLILYPDCYDDVAGEITPDDFFDESNRTLYEAIAALRDASKPVDVTLLVANLKAAGSYETVGGAAYIYRLTESVANASNAVYYSRLVREHALRRAIIQASTETLRDAYEERSDVTELVGQADARIAEISERTINQKSGGGHIKDVLHLAIDDLDARAAGRIEQRKSGLCGLDRIVGGFRKKQFIVFGAAPSQGKTSLLLKVALNLASGTKPLHVLLVTLEMGETELGERLLSMVAQVNSWRMQNGRCSVDDRRRIMESAGKIGKAPLWIRDPGSITASQLAAMCRSFRRKRKGLDVLCVDYLQLIQPEAGPRNESRQQQLGKITRRLKQIAKDQDMIVIAPAQVNREPGKANREPRMSDLREAGDIENDADMVVMCHMPGAENDKNRPVKSEDGEDCKLLVRKNRNGPTGEAEMYYFRAFSLWGDKQTNEEQFSEPPPQPRFSEFDNYNETTDQYGEV